MAENTQKSAENREIREFIEGIELRAAPEGSKSPGTMVGYAAVFDRFSEDLGYFREKLAKGCFRAALGRSDPRALVNHDASCLLGRRSAGTLRLEEDELGLKVEIDLPDTTVGRDTAESLRRGDMSGQSFCFTTAIDEWDWSGETPIRTVREVDQLYDVGPVTYPAYSETSAAMRSFQAEKTRRETPPPPPKPDFELDNARLRLLEVLT